MEDLLKIVVEAILEHGAIGILAIVGWALYGSVLYREYRDRGVKNPEIASRDEVIEKRETEIARLNEKLVDLTQSTAGDRIADLKELNGDYNEVVRTVNHTLEKLSISLQVKSKD